jgi:hypothetical protein
VQVRIRKQVSPSGSTCLRPTPLANLLDRVTNFWSQTKLDLVYVYIILLITLKLGFSTTAIILGGQTLANINPGSLPLVVGIVIIWVCYLIP